MSWTDERVEILKKMWVDGEAASAIAKELGGVTRNAVIGKVHRLGLSNRATKEEEAAEAEEAPAPPPSELEPEPEPQSEPEPQPEAATQSQPPPPRARARRAQNHSCRPTAAATTIRQ